LRTVRDTDPVTYASIFASVMSADAFSSDAQLERLFEAMVAVVSRVVV
jgi:hypothetical protein